MNCRRGREWTSSAQFSAPAAHAEIDLDALVDAIGQELLHYARVLAGSPESAEDAVQDTLVALLQEGSKAAQIRTPRAWLFTVLRRKALAYRKVPPATLAQDVSEAVETDSSERLALKEALTRLDALDQEIILLHLWEGLTFDAIGLVVSMPRNTVLSRYARAVERLRVFFGASASQRIANGNTNRQEANC